MTTNKPGSVNQNPLFGCMSCFLDHSWPAEDLRVYGGECWCDLCWGELRWGVDDLPYWDELPRFIPPYVAELEALQAECEALRELAAAALSGLPGSLPMEPYQTVDRSSPHYKAGWNACRRAMLDALEKLIAAHHEAHRKQGGGYRKAGNCR